MPDLAEQVRALDASSLQTLKRQLAALPEQERQRAFSRLSGIPELADIISRPTPEGLLKLPTPTQQVTEERPGLGQVLTSPEVPLWQKALSTFAAPFQWIHEKAIEPFASVVTAPFSPQIPGTEGMNWMERQLAEYRGWDAPWGVKGTLEMLPWLAIPGVGAVAGRAGMAGRGIAGMLGKAGPVGRIAGTALEYSPWGLVEKATGRVLGAIAKPITSKAARSLFPSKVWKLATEAEKIAITKEAGLPKGVASKLWQGMASGEKKAITERVLKVGETLKVSAKKLLPEGVSPKQQQAIDSLIEFVKEYRPLPAVTAALVRPVKGARAASYEKLLQAYRTQGIPTKEASRRAEVALIGKYPVAPLSDELKVLLTRLGSDEKILFDMIADAQFALPLTRLNTITSLQSLIFGGKLAKHQIALLEDIFGPKLAKELLKKRPGLEKLWDFTIDIANAPRALLASCDISGLLRQGAILSATRPIEGMKTVRPMLKAMFSDKNAAVQDKLVRSLKYMDEVMHPNVLKQLDLTALPYQEIAMLTRFEEAFASKMMNKIFFVRASNRAYVTVLNAIRARTATSAVKGWRKSGLKFNPKLDYGKAGGKEYGLGDISDLNQLVNWASGRGTLPKSLQQQGKLLNTIIFAPKLQMGRIQFPTAVLPMITKSPLVRREAWRELLTFVGVGASILTMAKMSGVADVELDPRSADFGKLKVGETRLDIWSGYSQYMRFMAQFAAEQRKSVGGRVYPVNRMDIAMRFAQTKLSPAAGLLRDIVAGETFLGEELPPKSAKSAVGQLYERMMPLAIQDMIDGAMQDGPVGGIVSSVGLLGIGVVTYTDEVKRERDKAAQKEYDMDWEEVGRQLGRVAQLRLEQTTPKIMEAEQEREERFTAGTPTAMQQWRNEGQSVEDTYREMIDMAVKEFQQTGDGRLFREKVNKAANYRRTAYGARAKRKDYQDIIAYYNQPLKPEQLEKMSPADTLRREYYKRLFAPDMYDEFGNYLFDEAERREQEFGQKHGQQALDYIEEYRGSTWLDKPVELKMLEEARDILKPYWDIADHIWSMYPPQLKELSNQIIIMERTDPVRAKQALKRYPQILRARELIARYRKQMRDSNPMINRAYRLFY